MHIYAITIPRKKPVPSISTLVLAIIMLIAENDFGRRIVIEILHFVD